MYEGSNCCATETGQCTQKAPQQACDTTGKTFPQVEAPTSTGFGAIIGGQVYRGRCFPDIVGTYFYTDNRIAEDRHRDGRGRRR